MYSSALNWPPVCLLLQISSSPLPFSPLLNWTIPRLPRGQLLPHGLPTPHWCNVVVAQPVAPFVFADALHYKSLSRWVPRLYLSPVISLNQNKPFITTVDFSAWRCSKKQQKTTFSLIILIVWHQRQTGGAPASVRQQSKGLSSLAALAHTENLKWGVKQQQPQVPGQHRQQARPLPLWLTAAFWLVLMKESCIRVDPGCRARSTVEAESCVTAD